MQLEVMVQHPWKSTLSRKARARKGRPLTRASPQARGLTTVAKAKETAVTLERVNANKRVLTLGRVNRRVMEENNSRSRKLDVNVCAYCGKSGHWQRDCHKKRADRQQQVRQIGELNDPKHETSVSNASISTGSGSQAVRLLSAQPCNSNIGHFEDLTIHSVPTSPSSRPHGFARFA